MRRGFTFLEFLVALAILSLFTAATAVVLLQGQWTLQTQTEMTRAVEQGRIAIDMVVRYLKQAGNDPFRSFEIAGTAGVEILGSDSVRINSDITGAVAGSGVLEASGDPDGFLTAAHESVTFSYDTDLHILLLDIGYGLEVIAQDVGNFELKYFDVAGNETAENSEVARVSIRLTPLASNASLQTGEVYGTTLYSEVFLRESVFDPFSGAGYLDLPGDDDDDDDDDDGLL